MLFWVSINYSNLQGNCCEKRADISAPEIAFYWERICCPDPLDQINELETTLLKGAQVQEFSVFFIAYPYLHLHPRQSFPHHHCLFLFWVGHMCRHTWQKRLKTQMVVRVQKMITSAKSSRRSQHLLWDLGRSTTSASRRWRWSRGGREYTFEYIYVEHIK